MLPDVVPINLWPDKEGAGDTNHHFYICVVWEVWEKNLIQKLVIKTLWDFFLGGWLCWSIWWYLWSRDMQRGARQWAQGE